MENFYENQKFLQEEPVPNLIYPGDRCCTFYEHENFVGYQHTECMGEYENEHITSAEGWGEWVTSFECGKNVSYEIHDYDYPDDYSDIMTGAGHLRTSAVVSNIDNSIKKVIMRPYDQWKTGSVTVWGKSNCTGESARFAASSVLDETATFTNAEAVKLGMGAEDMDSFHLPWGYELTLHAEDGMVGESKSFTGKSNIDDHDFMECVQLPSEWVNKARSYSIRKFQDIAGARVGW